MAQGPALTLTKRCGVCGRFREYREDDRYCIGCGNESLADHCECGRSFEYALVERGDIHCPRCGRGWGNRPDGFE